MKGGRLMKNEKWTIYDQTMEMAGELNYLNLGVVSSGGWNGQKLNTIANVNQTLIATDNCLPRTAVVRVTIWNLE
jgi:hypothetical protein